MTYEEWIAKYRTGKPPRPIKSLSLREAWEAGVQAERERCAIIAGSFTDGRANNYLRIVAAIRKGDAP